MNNKKPIAYKVNASELEKVFKEGLYNYGVKKGYINPEKKYYLYDTKTKINRGWAKTKQDAELLLKELSNKWYYKYLKIQPENKGVKND